MDSAREPPAARFTLLRLVGFLDVVVCLFGLGLAVLISFLDGYRGATPAGTLWDIELSVLPLLLCANMCYILTWSSRVDRAQVGTAWRLGVLREAPPRPPGSSLPYILPPSVTLAVLGLCFAMEGWEASEPDVLWQALLGGSLAVGGLLTGLAFDDLRLFLWRQRAVGLAYTKDAGLPRPAEGNNVTSSSNGLLFGIGASAGLACYLLYLDDAWLWRRTWPDPYTTIPLVFCLAGFGWTMTLLVRDADAAASAWPRADRGVPEPVIRVLCAYPSAWLLCAGALLVLWQWTGDFHYLGHLNDRACGFLTVTILCWALLMGRLLLQLHRWRKRLEQLTEDGCRTELSRTSWLLYAVFWPPLSLTASAVAATVLLGIPHTGEIFGRTSDCITGLNDPRRWLLYLGACYLPIWMAFVIRELVLVRACLTEAEDALTGLHGIKLHG